MSLLRAVFWFGVVLVPLFGVWLSSSLAAYWNGPVWLVVLAGALLFPLGPVAWDLVGKGLRGRGKSGGDFFADMKRKKRERLSLGFGDRLLIRTLVLNLTFVGLVLGLWPDTASTALSARGDWMLDGRDDAASEQARAALFHAADGLEWLFDETNEDPYEGLAEVEPEVDPSLERKAATEPQDTGLWLDTGTGLAEVEDAEVEDAEVEDAEVEDAEDAEVVGDAEVEDAEDAEDEIVADKRKKPRDTNSVATARGEKWPMPHTPHPMVDKVPAHAEESIEALGAWAHRNIFDDRERVRFLHDWVADHVAYDFPRLDDKTYIHFQDSETVFQQRVAVCAGYANLLVALGEASDTEIVYVQGYSRDSDGTIAGTGHAWNAAQVDDGWVLMDATWDAGGRGENGRFHKDYRTSYLFTPPEVFNDTHLPDNEAWQLVDKPVSRGDFTRQPMTWADFHAEGLSFEGDTRSQVTVRGQLGLLLNNPKGRHVAVTYAKKSKPDEREHCSVRGDTQLTVSCKFPKDGEYDVIIFTADGKYDRHKGVARIDVNSS
ncbi:MAG TPA: transglutaminase domain-containing protein [Myxococcota bacterium]|nr:transglutaminase domain-containing protein [Myxococcota bacterium]